MLVIRKKRFIFVFVVFVLLLLFTCICSYYFISNVDSFSIEQRKFVAENMIYIGIIIIIIVAALFGYVYWGSLRVFTELDKLKEAVKHGNYDRIMFQKRLGQLGLEISDLFVHLNSISGKKTEKISAISCLNTFLLENIRLKMLVIDVQGMILSVSTSFLTEYDFDKSDIKSEYTQNLNELAEYMKDNPGAKIEIGGHTDYVGTDEYNMVLSGRRAMAVKNYLVDRGVKQDKVEIKKYGESAPIASNSSSSTRKYNRRIEFKVLEQGSERYLKVVSEKSKSANNDAANATSEGKVYRVQLFALSKEKTVDSFGVPNLKVREVNGVYKYYLGDFSSKSEANGVLASLKDKYPEAIVLESTK